MAIEFIDKVLSDMKSGVYDFTEGGRCKGCGECCSPLLPVSDKEIDRIKKYIKKHRIRPQKVGMVFANPVYDVTCPFLRKDVSKDRCSIYPVRPEICVKFKCDHASKGKRCDVDIRDKKLVDMREIFGC